MNAVSPYDDEGAGREFVSGRDLGLYSLVPCNNCKEAIRDDDIWCPHCGAIHGVINPVSYEVAERISAQSQCPAETKARDSILVLNSSSEVLSPPKADELRPPQFGEYLLYFFLSKKERDNILGDLQEEYSEVFLKFRKTKARIWFYKQVFTSIWPLLRRAVLKWAALGGIGEWIRRIVC